MRLVGFRGPRSFEHPKWQRSYRRTLRSWHSEGLFPGAGVSARPPHSEIRREHRPSSYFHCVDFHVGQGSLDRVLILGDQPTAHALFLQRVINFVTIPKQDILRLHEGSEEHSFVGEATFCKAATYGWIWASGKLLPQLLDRRGVDRFGVILTLD